MIYGSCSLGIIKPYFPSSLLDRIVKLFCTPFEKRFVITDGGGVYFDFDMLDYVYLERQREVLFVKV